MVVERNMLRKHAEVEVYITDIVQRTGSFNNSLLYVLSEGEVDEDKVLKRVTRLLNLGARTSVTDTNGHTPLHVAAKRKSTALVKLLLDNGANPNESDPSGNLPLHLSLQNNCDEVSALLIRHMSHEKVRSNFKVRTRSQISDEQERDTLINWTATSNSYEGSQKRVSLKRKSIQKDPNGIHGHLSFRQCVIQKRKEVVLSVLDCFVDCDPLSSEAQVYYEILEEDENGLVPTDLGYNKVIKSPLHLIIQEGDKDILCHEVIRLLIRRKWEMYARTRFLMNFFRNLTFLFFTSFCAIVGVMADDPLGYTSAIHIARAVMEVACIISVLYKLSVELFQLQRHKLEYFKDIFNWLDFGSSALLLSVLPLRFTRSLVQWHMFAFGYLLTFMRIFKFAVVFNQTGAYVRILGKVLVQDFLQFGIVFLIFLFSFSCTFYMVLRGDNNINIHNETSSFGGILFVGLRSLVEVGPVIKYTGDYGYGVLNTMLMLCFLFTCVIMLNMLIAQLSYTYQKVQQDVLKELYISRAWIVDRVDRNSFFIDKLFKRLCSNMDYRTRYYKSTERVKDFKTIRKKWKIHTIGDDGNEIRILKSMLEANRVDLFTIKEMLHAYRHNDTSTQNNRENILSVHRQALMTDHTHEQVDGLPRNHVGMQNNYTGHESRFSELYTNDTKLQQHHQNLDNVNRGPYEQFAETNCPNRELEESQAIQSHLLEPKGSGQIQDDVHRQLCEELEQTKIHLKMQEDLIRELRGKLELSSLSQLHYIDYEDEGCEDGYHSNECNRPSKNNNEEKAQLLNCHRGDAEIQSTNNKQNEIENVFPVL